MRYVLRFNNRPFECLVWEGLLSSAYALLGFSLEKDLKALRVALLLDKGARINEYDCLEVVGPKDPEPSYSCPIMAVDGAVNLVEDYDLLVSDGDGADEEELVRASEERFLFLHVHGDNFERLSALPLGNNLRVTVQFWYPGLLCVPALSDGHRALVLAKSLAKEVRVTGFGEGEQSPKTKRALIHPIKERKLSVSNALYLLGQFHDLY